MKIIGIWKNSLIKLNKTKQKPVFFYKPETTLLLNNRPFYFPEYSDDIVCNAELVLRINKAGKYIQEKFAETYFNEIGISVNLTARDLQKECIKQKHPFDISYSFDGSSSLSDFISKDKFKDFNNINYSLQINDKIYQRSNTKEHLYSFSKIISFVSEYMMLKTGDLIFTGPTTEPFQIKIGDTIEALIEKESLIRFIIK